MDELPRAELGPIGVHFHDDTGNAVANALAAWTAGAVHVQGTINGWGERCGNLNLCIADPHPLPEGRARCHGLRQPEASHRALPVRRGEGEHHSREAMALRRGGGVFPQGRPARGRHQQGPASHGAHRRRPRGQRDGGCSFRSWPASRRSSRSFPATGTSRSALTR